MVARHLKRGEAGEAAAERYLKSKGYKIVERNWRTRNGELDLICRHGKTLVFVEVKTRDAKGMATPADALTATKQSRLVKAAMEYLSAKELWEDPCRFDLVGVVYASHVESAGEPEVEHLEDAFDISAFGDDSFQPF